MEERAEFPEKEVLRILFSSMFSNYQPEDEELKRIKAEIFDRFIEMEHPRAENLKPIYRFFFNLVLKLADRDTAYKIRLYRLMGLIKAFEWYYADIAELAWVGVPLE